MRAATVAAAGRGVFGGISAPARNAPSPHPRSSGAPGPPVAAPWPATTPRERASLLCRITNGGDEIFDEEDGTATHPKWVWSVPELPLNTPNPEMGPLPGKRIPHTWFDLQFDKTAFKEDSDYWFSEPPGGWKEYAPVKLEVLEEQPDIVECALNLGPGRVKLADMKEGMVLEGEVNAMSLNHGIQVDLGCEFDGLIAVRDRYMWHNLTHISKAMQPYSAGPLDIEQKIKVRVHKIRDPVIYRWPIQLVLESPVVECLMPEHFDPDSWRCPRDLRDVSKPEQLLKYFSEDEIRGATAKYRISKKYDFTKDELHDDEPYYYPTTGYDGEGDEAVNWVEVPRDKEGVQQIAEYEMAGIPLAGHSYLHGDYRGDLMYEKGQEEAHMNTHMNLLGGDLPGFDAGAGGMIV